MMQPAAGQTVPGQVLERFAHQLVHDSFAGLVPCSTGKSSQSGVHGPALGSVACQPRISKALRGRMPKRSVALAFGETDGAAT